MTWGEIYLKMIEDIRRVQLENWRKLERRVTHTILIYCKGKRRLNYEMSTIYDELYAEGGGSSNSSS